MIKTIETISSFFSENLVGYCKETICAYKSAIYQFFEFSNKDYDEVTRADIKMWLQSLLKQEVKPNSLHKKLAALKAYYNYLMIVDLVTMNPTIGIQSPKREYSVPRYLDRTEVASVLEYTKNMSIEGLMIRILFATGIRTSELLNIRKSDIMLNERRISIQKGKHIRFVYISQEISERIKQFLRVHSNRESPFLFSNKKGDQISKKFIADSFGKLSKALNLKVTPSMLRHTFAINLIQKGMPLHDIAVLLGHRSLNSIYALYNAQRRAKMDRYLESDFPITFRFILIKQAILDLISRLNPKTETKKRA